MATFVKFQDFVEQLGKAVHDLDGTHTLNVMLTNSAPTPTTDAVLSDLTEITVENGYSAGGSEAANPVWSRSVGTAKLVCDDVVFTASGGTIGPFRYAVLYNATATNLIAYWDYGSAVTLQDGETFTVDFDPSAGVFTIT